MRMNALEWSNINPRFNPENHKNLRSINPQSEAFIFPVKIFIENQYIAKVRCKNSLPILGLF